MSSKLELNGASDVGSVLGLINRHADLGLTRAALRVRSVAVRIQGAWHNFATEALIDSFPVTDPRNIEVRDDVRLTEVMRDLDSHLSMGDFASLLRFWNDATGTVSPPSLQASAHLHRRFSDPRVQHTPRWTTTLWFTGGTTDRANVPQGPYLKREENLFGSSLGALASQWLENEQWKQYNAVTYENVLTLMDRRARIVELRFEVAGVRVSIERNTTEALNVCVEAKSLEGTDFVKVIQAADDEVLLPLTEPQKSIEIWLTTRTGFAIDHYSENDFGLSWGLARSLYHNPATTGIPGKGLTEALDGGENEVVEFKPFIDLRRGSKREQIVESVCAFANLEGGTIYFGVSNHGEMIATSVDLNHLYGKELRGDLAAMKEAYERDLQKLVTEGLTPIPERSVAWQEVADKLVLELKVTRNPFPVSLVTNREAYVRAGATNRRIRPADLLHDLRMRTST